MILFSLSVTPDLHVEGSRRPHLFIMAQESDASDAGNSSRRHSAVRERRVDGEVGSEGKGDDDILLSCCSCSPGTTDEECFANYLELDCGHQLEYFHCVDSFPYGSNIKRLSLRRRPKAAIDDADKRVAGFSPGLWKSAESLSSSSSNDSRLLGMSTLTRGRPPLPPSYTSDKGRREVQEVSQKPDEFKPQPAVRSHISQSFVSQNPAGGVTQHQEQESTTRAPPQPTPRRRLASFGGVGSPGSSSPFTGVGAYNQNNNGNKPAETAPDVVTNLSSSSVGTRGSLGCLPPSPQNSGRTTPVAGSAHLQHVRDQMVKISVLQEEKRQLLSQLKSDSEDIWKKAYGSDGNDAKRGQERIDNDDLKEFKKLTEEMMALETALTFEPSTKVPSKSDTQHEQAARNRKVKGTSVTKITNTENVETKSVLTQVSEVHLGVHKDWESEIESQQLIITALKDRIVHLESELKQSAFQMEMGRLKLELQAAGARNRADKASSARPTTASAGVEAKPETTSQGAGNHVELRDVSSGDVTEMKTVGVGCSREMVTTRTGPDLPLTNWEVRLRVETRERGVEVQIPTDTRGVGTDMELCDAETNTDWKKTEYRSVACGDASVSQCKTAEHVKGIDFGIMVSPQTTSQRTNTTSCSVSRYTNTKSHFISESSTNTVLKTQDRHTNTTQAITRAVSVGSRGPTETRTIGIGTDIAFKHLLKMPSRSTRDTGVGFTNIKENFLVGMKTRNMASGPSYLPDPVKTRSVGIGVGDGKVQDLSAREPGLEIKQEFKWDPELDRCIERMQRLLREDGGLFTQDLVEQSKEKNGQDASKLAGSDNLERHSGPSLRPQPAVSGQLDSRPLPETRNLADPTSEVCLQGSIEVKKMIQMLEQQTSAARQEPPAQSGPLRYTKRRQNGEQSCSSTRRSMKLMRATAGLDPDLSFKLPEIEKNNMEDAKRRASKKQRDATHCAGQTRESKGSGNRGFKAPAKFHAQKRCNLSEKMFSACQALKAHLREESPLPERDLHDCQQTLRHEWFSVSSNKSASPDAVENYLSTFEFISPLVLHHIANLADGNGNTALHYSVSHSNFAVVRKLLETGVCNVNQQNKAGYTPVMLAALAAVETPADLTVLELLFSEGDINAKAGQAGQTALMLAVSHGKLDIVGALLAQGASVNLQDDEGSTALMCACEHRHANIVRNLLAQSDCDTSLTDSDNSTALSIALEAGHNDIAVLLYAHANFSRAQAGAVHRCGRFLSSSSVSE
ncbi:KN motif and ankyrin repeat domain-containing protein 1-like isoform X2 [Synchiropus splendidus]|uniref:KN motif and ankyrin repeat domain-containing protein 1-like isoform X2 n=1 Tax=Synchiropus splendidus TaxID=270530 RepID=UPI00237DD0CE|nr:KN motif and ankyrin repeat domain-containing protein 1-like isoform X2 [Synchiropus splendidus]